MGVFGKRWRWQERLRGCSPDAIDKPGKEDLIRVAGGHVEPDATVALDNAGSDFEEPESDGSGLGRAQFGSL